ncbi:amino acid adenylation domain-containing protein [Nocardia sp. NPDC058658]|uniref:amino acid adenylation domain-containing protein n=1 Tax=Nocardia sp. NPDC058658 TaxID=3346580 RepID=UPI00365A7820
MIERLDGMLTERLHAPNRLAVQDRGKAGTSYHELGELAQRVADELGRIDCPAGHVVALAGPSSADVLAGLWGILRAGHYYLPLDPGQPSERNRQIMERAGVRTVVGTLSDLEAMRRGAQFGAAVRWGVVIDGTRTRLITFAADNIARQWFADTHTDRAYVLHTSGSTGVPKGVVHTHASARAFVDWATRTTELEPADRVAGFAPLHFDLSVFDVFGTAWVGASLIPVPNSVKIFPRMFADFLAEADVSVLYTVPTALVALLRSGRLSRDRLRSLRLIVFAGEPMSVAAANELTAALPGCRLYNWYGPTETNVCTSFAVTDQLDQRLPSVPIGTAITGDSVFVIDDAGRPATEGELYVGGATVMSGYLNDPVSTRRCLSTPAGAESPCYRTGDQVRIIGDGVLVFLGRRDDQIKRNGFRIELSEIDLSLRSVAGVHDSVTLAMTTADRQMVIVSYVVCATGLTTRQILGSVRNMLPQYMIPDELAIVDEFPTTSNGKIDRHSLRGIARRDEA